MSDLTTKPTKDELDAAYQRVQKRREQEVQSRLVLRAQNDNLRAEIARLRQANEFLVARNIHLTQVNNRLREEKERGS